MPERVHADHINVTINGRQYRMACEEGQAGGAAFEARREF
jgi:cell division protein ZapA (FtsZ GTPase activity inhibitor)